MENEAGNNRVAVVLSVIAVVLMCVFIFYMSNRPADESDEMSYGVVYQIVGFVVPGYDQMTYDEQLYWQKQLNYPVRKTAHFMEYAMLGALVLNMLLQIEKARGRRHWAGSRNALFKLGASAWALSTAYACTDEIHQLFVSGRTGKITDVLIDSSGVLLGVLIVVVIVIIVQRRMS